MIALAHIALMIALATNTWGQEDPGKNQLGTIGVKAYFATNGDVKTAGERAPAISDDEVTLLRKEERLRFKQYRLLGSDQQPLYRSYENWAEPLKPSNEIMVRFEAQSTPTRQQAVIDLELWLSRKKTIKTDAKIEVHKPLLVLGPEWRGGRLIIAVSFIPSAKPKS